MLESYVDSSSLLQGGYAPSFHYLHRSTNVDPDPTPLLETEACIFTTLPNELLLQVFGFVVPTGLTLHVFAAKGAHEIGTVIHSFGMPTLVK